MKREIAMPSMKHPLALACAALLLLSAGGYVAQAATGPSYDPEALRLALAWERIKFQVDDPGELLNQMDSLGQQADALAEQHPDNTEVVIWDGIITSERASLANEHGGLTGPVRALQYATRARDLLDRMEKKDPKAFDAGAPTSLGVLYYRVPGFPMGFGDKKKARHYLEEAVRNAPNGLDAHYFYGDFLQEQGDYAKSAEVLKHALTLPAHPERPIWDKNRRIVIQELLAKVQSKAEK
jgi:tetratricopeptide (TPR) repeat protein